MAITREEVLRIAALARLDIAPDAVERVARQLSGVLELVGTLDALDLAGLEPTTFAPAEAPARADAPDGRRLDGERATAAAPETEDGYFIVPPVVEHLEP
jgi:aspartyl-tRNA(Asn)/glutamyl-tRNA(Gln) amidotransferase subunit C